MSKRGDRAIPQTTWIFDDGWANLKWLKKWWRRKKRIKGKQELRAEVAQEKVNSSRENECGME
jgi:hypothetical protein